MAKRGPLAQRKKLCRLPHARCRHLAVEQSPGVEAPHLGRGSTLQETGAAYSKCARAGRATQKTGVSGHLHSLGRSGKQLRVPLIVLLFSYARIEKTRRRRVLPV